MITGNQIFSTVGDGKLTVEVVQQDFPQPTGDQVLIKMEAAPINPSDLGLFTIGADLENAVYTPGKFVADVPGTAFSQYCYSDAGMCFPLGDVSSVDGASIYVNPMTALGFVETAKLEGHKAIINNAAASNLGQILQRICLEDDIELVNIVRKSEQVELMFQLGAKHVVNSSDSDFFEQLCRAIDETGANLGFDPVGGGRMINDCLRAMETVAKSKAGEYSRYGSLTSRKMYLYGLLNPEATVVNSLACGFGWTVSTWLLWMFQEAVGEEVVNRMRKRVLGSLTTTFASSYKRHVTLEEMLTKDSVLDYRNVKTGEKYLVIPHG